MPIARSASKQNVTGAIRAAAVSLTVLLCGGAAYGQAALPDELIANPQLSGSEQERLNAFVTAVVGDLSSRDAEAARDARDEVLESLERDSVSVDFRIRYAEALLPTVRKLMAAAEPGQRLTGLRLAGALATEDSADLVVAALQSQEPSERYMAVSSMGRIFRASASQPPAVSRNRLQRLVSEIDQLVRAEQDAAIVDTGARALLDASAIPNDVIAGVAAEADAALFAALSERVQNADAAEVSLMTAAMRALESAQRRILGEGLSRPLAQASAALAGDSIAMLVRTGADGPVAVQLAGAADALIVFATENLDPRAQANPANLGQAVENGNLAEAAEAVIGPDGVLTRPPHGLPADRFSR